MESSVAITTLSPKTIEQRAARGTGDLLQAVPGIWADNSSGEVGSKVVARGLAPVGNDQVGFQYLSLQEEGLPVMGAQMGFALVDMFHRNDLNTGRFEAIRGGSAATLINPSTYATVPAPFGGQIQGSFVGSILSPTYYDAKTGEILAKVINGVLEPNTPNKLGNFLLATAPLNLPNQRLLI